MHLFELFRRPRAGPSKLRFHKTKRQLARLKNKQYPKLPVDCREIRQLFQNPNILRDYGTTLRNDANLYVETIVERNFAFTLFKSDAMIDYTRTNIRPTQRNYLLDGTFKSAPKQYQQLLTISIEHNNNVC